MPGIWSQHMIEKGVKGREAWNWFAQESTDGIILSVSSRYLSLAFPTFLGTFSKLELSKRKRNIAKTAVIAQSGSNGEVC